MPNLGLGLDLGKKRSTAWQSAAAAGTGADWLAEHKRLARRVSRIDPATTQGTRIQQFMQSGATPWQSPSTPVPTAPAPGTPAPNTPATNASPSGASGQPVPNKPMSMSDMAQLFAIKTPQELEAVSAFAPRATTATPPGKKRTALPTPRARRIGRTRWRPGDPVTACYRPVARRIIVCRSCTGAC